MSRRRTTLVILLVALGSTISVGVLSQRRQLREPQPQRKRVTTIPPTFSKVKTLEIVSTKIVDENTPFARVAVEIRNNTDKAVMAVDLVSGEGAVTRNGLTDAEKPIVVIEPRGTMTMHMTFGAMTPGAPLVVSAVTYADGTEDGDEQSLKAMHAGREHDKEKLRAEREKGKGDPR